MNVRFGSKLLSIKMTLQFILFGIIVGYFSLLFNMLITTRKVFDGVIRQLNNTELTPDSQNDWIYNIFVIEPEKGSFFLDRLMDVIPSDQKENVSMAIFYKTPELSWQMLTARGRLAEPLKNPLTLLERWNEFLDKTLEKDVVNHKPIYLGQAERNVMFLNLTPENSRNSYVAVLEFNQTGLREYLFSQWDSLKVYTVSLIVFSFILGHLFTFNLSRTIRRLTDNALKVARGEPAGKFKGSLPRFDDVGVLARALDTMTYNLNHRAESMETMNKIDRAVLSSLSRQELLSQVAAIIAGQFSPAGVCVLEKGTTDYHVLALISEDKRVPEKRLPYPGEEEILFDPPGVPFDFTGPSLGSLNSLFGMGQVKENSVGYPLVLDEKVVGIIVITRETLDAQDRESLRMLADQAGVALKSLTEFKARERLNQGLLLSLTRSVDAKSQWTAGHSERVTQLALLLSEQINASPELKQLINMGGLLHDIGKLAIPEAILDKPGKLTHDEFDIIRSHPMRGYEILQEIPNFEQVQMAVRSHHERWDGTGYPDRLKGEEIPFISRMITICDVYDAISEDRPYRKGFTRAEVGDFLLKERGKLFDPELLDQFLKLLETR